MGLNPVPHPQRKNTATPSPKPQPLSAISQRLLSSPASPGSSPAQNPHFTTLATQILHDLTHAHHWRDLNLHTTNPAQPSRPLPRPLISGIPPTTVYIHPDDQAASLNKTPPELKDEGQGASEKEQTREDVEAEWVLPTHLREKWTLKRLAEVFDTIDAEPPDPHSNQDESGEESKQDGVVEEGGKKEKSRRTNKKRRGKRILLAVVGDDSTIVYYIVHDGIVKPRQN